VIALSPIENRRTHEFRALYFLGGSADPHPPEKTWRLGEVPQNTVDQGVFTLRQLGEVTWRTWRLGEQPSTLSCLLFFRGSKI